MIPNRPTIELSEANDAPLVDGYKFNIDDYVYLNSCGTGCYGLESQWLELDAEDAGFGGGEYPDDCFKNNGNEYFTEFVVIDNSDLF